MTEPSETRDDERARGPLYRSRSSRLIAGVAGGLGEYFGVDPIWIRVGFVLLAAGGGSGLLIYVLMWILVPERPVGESAGSATRRSLDGTVVLGIILVAVGTIALMNTVAPWLGRFMWPLVLIGGGVVLLTGGWRR